MLSNFTMCTIINVFVVLTFTVTTSRCARILAIVPTPSYSHQIMYRPLWRQLSSRGHQLKLLTTDPMNDASLLNLTEVNLHFSYELWNNNIVDIINASQVGFIKSFQLMATVVHNMTDQQLQHRSVQALIRNETEHFDLLIVEFGWIPMYAFANRFNCPLVGVTSFEPLSYAYGGLGSPEHPVLYPDSMLPFGEKLTLVERIISTSFYVAIRIFGIIYALTQEDIVEKHFGVSLDTYEMFTNISMLFINTNPIFNTIRPLVPAIVEIGGGIHREQPKPLPKELQKTLDDATQGFIYFSLGTNVKRENVPKNTLINILKSFSELPYLVLFKFDPKHLQEVPSNVMVSHWFPQQDIMSHRNIKLFITQGGRQSLDEAIYECVPIIGMPFFADQTKNIKILVNRGAAEMIDYTLLEKEHFKTLILEVINNPRYYHKLKELVEIANDQPMNGLEKAVWWIEYVIRHKGAKHLRSPALDLPLYQYLLLDVIAVLFIFTITITYLIYMIIKLCLKLLRFLFKPKLKME